MCIFEFDKLFCPDCRRDNEQMISIPSAPEGSACEWAEGRRARPIDCRYRREAWSGAWAKTSQPCRFCRREREVSRNLVKEWAKKEEAWREQNPLEDRVGEDIPEADRGWTTPSIHEDDASTSADQEPRRDEPNTGSEVERKKLKLVKKGTRPKN